MEGVVLRGWWCASLLLLCLGGSCASGMVVRFVAVAMPRGRLCFGDGGVFRGLVFMAWCSSYHTAVWVSMGRDFFTAFTISSNHGAFPAVYG